MTDPASDPPSIEASARELVAAVRATVDQIGKAMLRMQMQGSEAEKGLYAQAALEALFNPGMMPLCEAHDALGAALNAASPDVPPILSLRTERPA